MVCQSIKQSYLNDELNVDYDSDQSNLKINEEVAKVKPRNSVKGEGKMFDIKHYKNYLFPSFKPGTAYILAIIDYFQMFNFYKVVESGIKTKFAKNAEGVSCVDPETYSKRFIKYFETLTDIKKFYKDNNKIDIDKSKDYYENNQENTATTYEGSNIEMQAYNNN